MPLGSGPSPKTRQQLRRAELRKKICDLRVSGASFARIGEMLGISTSNAFQHFKKALRDIPLESAKTARQVELERLDIATLAIAKKIREGNAQAILAMLKISERRAKLLGLDAPTTTRLTGEDGGPLAVEHVAPEAVLAKLAKLSSAGNDPNST